MEKDIFEKATDPENPDALERLADISGPALDRQLTIIQSLNDTLVRLSRTALVLLGVALSGFGLANQGYLPKLGTFEMGTLLLSLASLLLAAVLGFMTIDHTSATGVSDSLYRDAIEKGYTKTEIDGAVALSSGSHMGDNIATISVLFGKIEFVQAFLGAGTMLLGATAILLLSPRTPIAVVVVVVELIVVSVILYKWNMELQESRKKISTQEFPEFDRDY